MPTTLPLPSAEAQAHSNKLCEFIHADIQNQGDWIPFSRFMDLALYAPGLGYYSAGAHKFGAAGDFVTAPEISSFFGRSLARQIADILVQSELQILELGAGSGKLAVDILGELERMHCLPERYDIMEVSADLRGRQQALIQARLPHLYSRVHWLNALPEKISGVVIANEVLDALPVSVLRWCDVEGDELEPANPIRVMSECGVISNGENFEWQERMLTHIDLLEAAQKIVTQHSYVSEISLAARGLVSSLCERLQKGVLLFIDYGFGAGEYYHPQRNRGTLMCHYRHYAHDDPFFLPGLQDITAHVDFTAVAESAIDSGAELLGYTTQAYFLLNCGITEFLQEHSPDNVLDYLPLSSQVQKLTSPAEMGELFKVIALGKGIEEPLHGFERGDLSRLL
jgi:SAM-dependent MidA family methyltransferase